MSDQPSPVVPQPPPAVERTRRAWLAHQRQELLAPAHALVELSEMLAQDARDRGREDFRDDLEKVRQAGHRLLTLLLQDVLGRTGEAAEAGGLAARVRHDLRTPLAEIIGVSELWLEDADEQLLEGFVGDLREVRAQARKLLASLDDFLGYLRAPDGPPAGGGDSIEEAIVTLYAAPELGAPLAHRATLLVVDDNDSNRAALRRRLTRQGHAVAVAADGREALERVRDQPPDLILLDVILPGLSGFQVLERLKADERLRHIPVIMMSALDEVDSVVRCIETGAEDYLTKPFNPVLLQARIGACLEKKRLLEAVEQERRRADELLHVILPGEVVQELKATDAVRPRRFEDVAVLFADVAGFTPFCDRSRPEEVVEHLQALVERAEEIALAHGVEKIKTIGDAFMAAAGLLRPAANPVLACLRCGLDLLAAGRALPTGWDLRVGIHVGPVVAGVIGRRQYLFDLWGDTVNTAARLESHGLPGTVSLSGPAWQRVAGLCRGEPLGPVAVKGKGTLEVVRFAAFLPG
jgi:CheY-like chemotaxis protein